MNSPASHIQKAFFDALRRGNVADMQRAYEKGADPHKPSPEEEGVSAWLYASLLTPLSNMQDVFALLETWKVARRHGPCDRSTSHPCIELTLRTSAATSVHQNWRVPSKHVSEHVIRQGYKLAWDLWQTLEKQERRRVLSTLDMVASNFENGATTLRFMPQVEPLWRERGVASFMEDFSSREFCSLRDHLRKKKGDTPPSFSEETLLWCLQSLRIHTNVGGIGSAFNDSHPSSWGFHFLTAPDALLKEYLETPSLRTLIMERLSAHSVEFFQFKQPDAATKRFDALYDKLVQHFHTRGAPWPEAWPESTRAQMLKFPSIRRFAEQQVLKRALEQESDDKKIALSPLRPRL